MQKSGWPEMRYFIWWSLPLWINLKWFALGKLKLKNGNQNPLINFITSCIDYTSPVVIGTDYIGSCKSNYHTITITTAPQNFLSSCFVLMLVFWLAVFSNKYKSHTQKFYDRKSRSQKAKWWKWNEIISR